VKRRQRILDAVAHREPDRPPIGFDLFEPLRGEVLRHFGAESLEDLHGRTGIDGFSVWDWPSVQPAYVGPPRPGVEAYDRSMAYGCWGKVGERIYPLRDIPLDAYRWPRVEDFDFSALAEGLRAVRDRDMTTASGHAGCGWLHHVQMRSYDQVFYDILDDAFMEEYIGRNREFLVAYFRELFRQAGGLVDFIRADEDLGGQDRMLIPPDLWRRWYKPLWKEIFDLCHRHGARVWLHSCGYCRPLVEDFIGIGVDVLNPLPPYVKDGDPLDMKRTYGDRLAFDGGVDQMNVLVQGNPEAVRQEVRRRLRELSPGGGYIVGPSQVLSRDVPAENAIAFLETALEGAGGTE